MSAAQVLSKVRKISLEVVKGPLKGGVFHFAKPLILIGRGLENDLVIEHDSKVSRLHVEIRQNAGAVTIHNVSERNTLMLNGQLVRGAALEGSCKLLIGDSEFHVQVEALAEGNRVPTPMPPPAKSNHLRAVTNHGASRPPMPARPIPLSNWTPNSNSNSNSSFAGSPPKRTPPSAAPPIPGASKNSKLLFYAILGIVILVGGHFASDTISKHRQVPTIKTTEEVDSTVKLSTETTEEIEKRLEQEGVDTRSYQTAQQQYVRGFRDYNQGQFSRAIRELSAAITYYPQHELAKRYLSMAQKRQDELVQEELNLGQKYRGQASYRMCVASFKKVIMLLDDPEDKISKEAEQLMHECELQQRERY